MKMTVWAYVDVEASSPDEALEISYDSPDAPGSMGHDAFYPASVDGGEWEACEVVDANGSVVLEV